MFYICSKVEGIISGLNAIVLDKSERSSKMRVLAQVSCDWWRLVT